MLSSLIPTTLPTTTPTTGTCAVCQRGGFKLSEDGTLSRHGYTRWRNGNRRSCAGSHHVALELSDATLVARADNADGTAAWAQLHLHSQTNEQLVALARLNRWFPSVRSVRSRLENMATSAVKAAAEARALAATHPCNAPAPKATDRNTTRQPSTKLVAKLAAAVPTTDMVQLVQGLRGQHATLSKATAKALGVERRPFMRTLRKLHSQGVLTRTSTGLYAWA